MDSAGQGQIGSLTAARIQHGNDMQGNGVRGWLVSLAVDAFGDLAHGPIEHRLALFLGGVEMVVTDRAPGEVMVVFDAIQRGHPDPASAYIAQAHVVALRSRAGPSSLFQQRGCDARRGPRPPRQSSPRPAGSLPPCGPRTPQLSPPEPPGERLVPGFHRQVDRLLGLGAYLSRYCPAGDKLDRRLLGKLLVLRRA